MNQWEDYVRKVVPYVPGEQPREEGMIKLNTNENPYPPSPAVLKVIRDFQHDSLRLYPDPEAHLLVDAIAEHHHVKPEQVFAGVGSDDVLAMCFLTFFNSENPIFFPDITYSFYKVWAELFGIPYETKKLTKNFELDPKDYAGKNGGIIFPNPNAPTSVYLKLDGVKQILEQNKDVIVIVDEAYIDFGGVSALTLLDEYENLLVVRTFSKSRSMAGMRIGYAIGAPKVIQYLNDVKFSFNSYTLNELSILCGAASMRDEEYFRKTLRKVIDVREWTKEQLKGLGFSFPDSHTNFLFAAHSKYSARELFEALKKEKIYVRYFPVAPIDNYLRISIGTKEQMEKMVDFLHHYCV